MKNLIRISLLAVLLCVSYLYPFYVKLPASFTASSEINIYSRPDSSAAVIKNIKASEEVTVLALIDMPESPDAPAIPADIARVYEWESLRFLYRNTWAQVVYHQGDEEITGYCRYNSLEFPAYTMKIDDDNAVRYPLVNGHCKKGGAGFMCDIPLPEPRSELFSMMELSELFFKATHINFNIKHFDMLMQKHEISYTYDDDQIVLNRPLWFTYITEDSVGISSSSQINTVNFSTFEPYCFDLVRGRYKIIRLPEGLNSSTKAVLFGFPLKDSATGTLPDLSRAQIEKEIIGNRYELTSENYCSGNRTFDTNRDYREILRVDLNRDGLIDLIIVERSHFNCHNSELQTNRSIAVSHRGEWYLVSFSIHGTPE
ncbi:hypothetical protein CHISP_0567 [Chitinispirillum alkaliphilum]|nr:hypothetical protein CHISP_0567 [Chitinispirillum alkaliphilum]